LKNRLKNNVWSNVLDITEVRKCPKNKLRYPFIKKNKPGTRVRLRKGLQITMDWLTDWRTDGMTDWLMVQYLSEYVLRCKKGTLKNQGEIFSKKSAKSKNWNVHLFCYMNSNCVFSKALEEKKTVAQWKGLDWIFNNISGTGGNSEPNGNVRIFFT